MTEERKQEILEIIRNTNRRPAQTGKPLYPEEIMAYPNLCEEMESISRTVDGFSYRMDILRAKNRGENCPLFINIHGGGFIGSLWPEEDKMIRKVLEQFPSNNIIVLPQTLYFTEEDRKIIDIYRELVDNCSNIKICVREKYSYEFALQNGINNVLLVPDMVTYITKDDLGITTPITRIKNKIIFCLRSDKEKNVSDQSIEKIKKYLKNKNIYYIDTFENRTVYPVNRKRNLRKKLLEFSDSEAVITDRLHGMVFAAIMNTPCMVLTNCNYKIKGVYEWISNNSFIHFVDEEKDIYYVLELLKENTDCSYNNKTVRESFEPLIKLLGD